MYNRSLQVLGCCNLVGPKTKKEYFLAIEFCRVAVFTIVWIAIHTRGPTRSFLLTVHPLKTFRASEKLILFNFLLLLHKWYLKKTPLVRSILENYYSNRAFPSTSRQHQLIGVSFCYCLYGNCDQKYNF